MEKELSLNQFIQVAKELDCSDPRSMGQNYVINTDRHSKRNDTKTQKMSYRGLSLNQSRVQGVFELKPKNETEKDKIVYKKLLG